jgi:hypothetical protein
VIVNRLMLVICGVYLRTSIRISLHFEINVVPVLISVELPVKTVRGIDVYTKCECVSGLNGFVNDSHSTEGLTVFDGNTVIVPCPRASSIPPALIEFQLNGSKLELSGNTCSL